MCDAVIFLPPLSTWIGGYSSILFIYYLSEFSKEAYKAAQVDPIAQFSKPVAVLLLIWHLCGIFFSSIYHIARLYFQ